MWSSGKTTILSELQINSWTKHMWDFWLVRSKNSKIDEMYIISKNEQGKCTQPSYTDIAKG